MYKRSINTPIGMMEMHADENGITALKFGCEEAFADETEILLRAERELNEYFAGRRKDFSVPLSMHGTDFQIRVWKALIGIPYGEVRTYAQIARSVGCDKGYRAVGMANHVNSIPIMIPCHRVIGSDGKLTGYAGGLGIKKQLLKLEGYNVEV